MNIDNLTLPTRSHEPQVDISNERTLLKDYWIALVSQEVSLQGRKDVLSGKGKFGILAMEKKSHRWHYHIIYFLRFQIRIL